jgi:hypothetical protein
LLFKAEIHKMFLEVFQAATSKDPPAGIGHFPLSRAVYGIDLLLQWSTNEKGKLNVLFMLMVLFR